MKRHISYILGILAIAMLASCVKVDINPVQVDDTAMVSLTLKSTEPVATRADGAANSELNENKINSVQCFFSNDGENILFSARKEGLNVSNGIVGNLNLEISSADLAQLNNDDKKCHVFAVVNCAELTIPEDKKISTLKSNTVAFSITDNSMQDSFVMVGTANNLVKGDNKLSGTVQVKRVAAKVNVILKVPESISITNEDGTETWKPYFDADDNPVSLTFNVKSEANLADADIDANTQNPTFSSFENENVTVTATAFNGLESAEEGKYTVTMKIPFYTYPMSWENQNYITLQLPWKKVATDGSILSYDTYEYLIPVQDYEEGRKLLSNNEYELTVNVGVLSMGTIQLTPSYQVANWGTGEINAELSRPKYLVVEKGNHVVDGVTYHYVMNNTTELTIPFHSSDDCTIIISCKQTNLQSGNITEVERNDNATSVTNKSFKAVLNNGAKTVTITHGVNNDLYDSNDDDNGVFDFTPYIYVLTITHDGDSSFKETINIIQYPAMYGTAYQNSDYSNGGDKNGDNGFVWVNGYQGKNDSDVSNFDNAYGLGSSSDLNAYSMYVFTVTSLEGTGYVLGDPRTKEPATDWIDDYTWGSGRILGSNDYKNIPNYYLPTDAILSDGSDSYTYNMIAPKFRVCSAYGQINTNGARRYYDNVKGRCASYQEDGYPAGRWRLPTKAEFELINTLSNKHLLPTLFVDGMDYWCAHGYGAYQDAQGKVVLVHNDSDWGGSDRISVRCVYDDWYWGSEPALKTDAEKKVFTWGDEPR